MGKTSKSTQTVTIPPEVLARYNAVNARAQTAANTPFKMYGGEFVAGLTDTQRSGMSNINAAANMAQPYYGAAGEAYGAGLDQGQGYLGAATGYAQQGGRGVNASDLNGDAINKYMSPYLQNVLQGTAGLLNQQNQQAMSGQTGNAIRQGAFGGDRGGIAAANLQQQQRLADSSIFSNILNQGYNNALNTAVGQQAVNLSAEQANRTAEQQTADRMAALGQQGFNQYTTTGQNVAALGTAAQNSAIQGGQAQMNAGQVEQATNQALDTALYNQFQQQQSYPFQTAQFLANIAQGTGALSGSTTTTAQPGGFFSDARLKENIQKVGKTYDGQHIYRYNYKGDPTTQIGLIAQEVEHHHPDAVGSKNSYRTVDYDRATDKAADRGHFYAGGLVNSMGGGVNPMHANQGYADGGLAGVDPAYMAELYRRLHEITSGGRVGGMQGIPITAAQIRELIVAKGLQEKQGNDAADAANAIDSFANLGRTVGVLDREKKEKAFGGEIEDLEAKRREEEAGLARAALETVKVAPAPEPTGLAAPVKSDINPITPVKIDTPKDEIKFGEKTAPQKLAVANAPVKPTNHGSETIGDLGKIVQIASSIAGMMNQGGRINRDMGGSLPYSNGDSIVPQQDNAKPQLMTAQGTGAGGGGGGKAIGQIAGLASSLIPGGGIVKKGLGMVSKIFSDERMKENIRPIGELFDGQKVHSFNYKGDPRTQIGLIAQEVEHHRPHAVDHDHGMKTVDYHDATQHAMRRGHFAEGGMPEEEMEEGAPQMMSPALASLLRGIKPLGNKAANFSDRLTQDRYSNLHNIDDEGRGLAAAAGASPPPAENMLLHNPAAKPATKPATKSFAKAKQPAEAGLTAKMDNTPLPTGIAQIARLIHAGEGTGQNPDSSALGPYQFLDKTFVGQFRKNYPDRAKGMSDSAIISLKRSPEGAKISSEMGPKFIADNAKIIQRGGHEPDAGNVYLAHFLGAGTAVNVLNADPSEPISRYVKDKEINANKILQNGATAGSVINWARGRMAQQERNLSRESHAEGGLAGRNGYQDAGAVAPTYSPSQQEQINFEENKRKEAEKADLQKAMQGIEFKEIILAPGTSAKAGGLGASLPTATPVDVERAVANNNEDTAPPPVDGSEVKVAGTPERPKRGNVFQRVLGLDKPYDKTKDNNFFHRLGHGETDAVLAALQGLAAFGTAPTENPGVAFASGLGAGAQAFQGQREFGRKEAETAAQTMTAEATKRESFNNTVRANAEAIAANTGKLGKLMEIQAKVERERVAANRTMDLTDAESAALFAKMTAQELELARQIETLRRQDDPKVEIPDAVPANGAPTAGLTTQKNPQQAPAKSTAFALPIPKFDASNPNPATYPSQILVSELRGAPTGDITQLTDYFKDGLKIVDGKLVPDNTITNRIADRSGVVATTTEAVGANRSVAEQITGQVSTYQNYATAINDLQKQLNEAQKLGQSLPPDLFTRISNIWSKVAALPEEQVSKSTAQANIVNAARALFPDDIPAGIGTDINAVNTALGVLFNKREYIADRNTGIQAAMRVNAQKGRGHEYDDVMVDGRRMTFQQFVNEYADRAQAAKKQKRGN